MSGQRRTAWLSRGIEELLHELSKKEADDGACHFDVVIVGSGYGGAVAAAELAGCTTRREGASRPISVCVLERGKEYLSGMFPSRMAELPGHVRFSSPNATQPRGQREGLFDFRVGEDISALVASGIGGGSLINAGVMEAPGERAFEAWPPDIWPELRDTYLAKAKKHLGVSRISMHRNAGVVAKHAALHALARGMREVQEASITVAMRNGPNGEGVARRECKLCGDCATGCNHEAKESLDVNLLATAHRRGAHLFTGATVLRVARDAPRDAWLLEVVYTEDKLRRRQGLPLRLRARQVILAAGTFGSTEILMRSRCSGLGFSRQLGQRFSGNGDSLAAVYGQGRRVNNAADESMAYEKREIGPTITGIADLRDSKTPCLIEDLAIPGPLRRAFEEVITTSHILHELGKPDRDMHTRDGADPCAVDADALMNTAVVAMMGDDGAGGSLELVGAPETHAGDGAIRVRWPELRNHPVFDAQAKALEDMRKANARDARILPNPLWQLLPQSMAFLVENRRGPAFTVHPLGGCPIGAHGDDGVVNGHGEVFNPATPGSTAVWPGLAVLDGSIVRSALAINPALTIAALAFRAVEGLRKRWGYAPPAQTAGVHRTRPLFAAPRPPSPSRPTEIEIVERMSAPIVVSGKDGGRIDAAVELELRFSRTGLGDLLRRDEGSRVPLARQFIVREGTLRLYERTAWNDRRLGRIPKADPDRGLLVSAKLSGSLTALHRDETTMVQRGWRALRAYFLNRGVRDFWHWWWHERKDPDRGGPGAGSRWLGALALATRAGERRLLEYKLTAHTPRRGSAKDAASIDLEKLTAPDAIRGRKCLTYEVASNPWRQLMELALEAFPGVQGKPVLELDTNFLAAEGVPLLRIVGQQDQPGALADLFSFGAYFLRLLLMTHMWSFRKPDAAAPRQPQRLPGALPKLQAPEIRELELDRLPDGAPVRVRLTRYRPKTPAGPPVVLIHGYSTSGTCFAHPAVQPNMAGYLAGKGRDVWVVDLRTSIGMPTARWPWAFEDAALEDIPAAIEEIWRLCDRQPLDVFAHCIGSAMFSMAVLAEPGPAARFFRERTLLPHRVRRAVLSQIAPRLVMSPANIFRGYVMGYLRHYLPLADYDFRVPDAPGLADQLLDRLLATMPYPGEEFRVENPRWPCKKTPWVGTRHRMDALYGRAFTLADPRGQRIEQRVLEHIDDLFGPPSIETVSQTIQFARHGFVTNAAGRTYWTSAAAKARWRFPTLHLHGADNGLVDAATVAVIREDVRKMGLDFESRALEGFGHQDSLIGKDAGRFFAVVSEFLDQP